MQPYKCSLKIPNNILASPDKKQAVLENSAESLEDNVETYPTQKQTFETMYQNLQSILNKIKIGDKDKLDNHTIYLKVDDNYKEETKDTDQNQSFGCSSMEIVKSIRLSPKNTNFPSVEVLHFGQIEEGCDPNPQSQSKSNGSIQSFA